MSTPPTRFSLAPRILAATLEHKGPYDRIGEGVVALKSWMAKKKLKPAGNPFALYYDNPEGRDPAELRSEVCIPVESAFASTKKVKFKEFPQTEVAETRHLGPPEEFAKTYGPFLEWLLGNGFEIVGPAREFYDKVSKKMGPGSGILIQQPIRKK
ncbi:MAG TPA: GyrI-like domain-containing protein [Nitrososphaerales archaeon]|nr:GyrI-like domain-containing protein [Nitrososphaerales archaeon]